MHARSTSPCVCVRPRVDIFFFLTKGRDSGETIWQVKPVAQWCSALSLPAVDLSGEGKVERNGREKKQLFF